MRDEQRPEGSMATRSSYFLAVLLIANPFTLVLFQNCASSPKDRKIASSEKQTNNEIQREIQREKPGVELGYQINKNLIIK